MDDEKQKALAEAEKAVAALTASTPYKPLLPTLLPLDRQDRGRLIKHIARVTGAALDDVRQDFKELERERKAQAKAAEALAEVEAQLGEEMFIPPTLEDCLAAGDFLPLLVALGAEPWEQDQLMPPEWGRRPTPDQIAEAAKAKGYEQALVRDFQIAPLLVKHRALVATVGKGLKQSLRATLRGALVAYRSGGDAGPIPYLVSGRFIIVATGDNREDEVPKPYILLKLFRDDNNLSDYLLPLTSLKDKNWGADLSDRDLQVLEPGLFAQALQLARSVIEDRFVTAERPGWVRAVAEAAFAMPSGDVLIADALPKPNIVPVFKRDSSWKVSGDKNAADEMLKLCAGNNRLVLATCVPLASPYVSLLGAENGGVHLFGQTSHGKTTLLCVGASMFGKGALGRDKGIIRSWNTTLYALGLVGPMHNDLVLLYDELKTVVKKEQLQQIVHMLSQGIGKDAGGAGGLLREKEPFTLQLLSTGECSVQDAMKRAGVPYEGGDAVRLLDVPAVPRGSAHGVFERLPPGMTAADFSDYLKATSKAHYGHHGRAVIQHIIGNRDSAVERATASIAELRFELGERFGDEPDVGRVLDRLSIYGGVGIHHSEVGLIPLAPEVVVSATFSAARDWMQARGGEGTQEALTALKDFEAFLERYASHFKEARGGSLDESTLEPAQFITDIAGITWLDQEGRREYWFSRDQLIRAVGLEQRFEPFITYMKGTQNTSAFELICDPRRSMCRTPRKWDSSRTRLYRFRRRGAS